MTAEKKYVYPDSNDIITAAMIKDIESIKGEGYWQRSENKILDRIEKYIERYVSIHKNNCFLDAGCGEGRLLPKLEKYFDNLLLIEPDKKRMEIVGQLVKKLDISNKIETKNISIESLETDWKFDVILCSHVLQHVHTNSVFPILEKFSKLLNKKGMLFITTCNSTKQHDYFIKHFLKKSKPIEQIISMEEFNSIINNKTELPVHFFTRNNITHLLEKLDFKLYDFKTFHMKRDMFIAAKL